MRGCKKLKCSVLMLLVFFLNIFPFLLNERQIWDICSQQLKEMVAYDVPTQMSCLEHSHIFPTVIFHVVLSYLLEISVMETISFKVM